MNWKKFTNCICIIVIIVFGAVLVNEISSNNIKKSAIDIGIIGGSDGPTKVFIVSNGISLLEISTIICSLIILIYMIIRKKKDV